METINLIISIMLIILSGMFSGLNLGLMTLTTFQLRRLIKMGNKDAEKIYPLRKNGNLLLTTILLGNVAVNTTLAIFLSTLTTGVVAGIVSTGLIVIFGEIIPQATFAKHALKLGAKTTWLIWIFLYILYPITKPISMILDAIIGKETPKAFTKKEFRLLMEDQIKIKGCDLDEEDIILINRGLQFSDKTVETVMTPKHRMFYLDGSTIIDRQKKELIQRKGHSRIPVYDKRKDRVIGIIYAKDLITLDPDESVSATKIMRKTVLCVKDTSKLDDILEKFKEERIHLFVVKNKNDKFVGIVTLEDVIEEITGEIEDEHTRDRILVK